MTSTYRIDRIAKQRPDSASSYPVVSWRVVRCADDYVVADCPTKREASSALLMLNDAATLAKAATEAA
jgi:hypothetical protein